jgi:hypothetical protein
MTDPESNFARELENFGDEVQDATQCFSVWITMHSVARRNRKVFDIFNQHARFWNTCARAVQANSLLALGRIFDKNPRSHSIERLLQLAEKSRSIFSRDALEKRVQKRIDGQLLDNFMGSVYVPSARDFQRLRRHVDSRRKVAHKDRRNVSAFAAKTNIRELGRLLDFLNRFYHALWHLLHNGRKPNIGPARHSSQRRIASETRKFLKSLIEAKGAGR